ncbi:MAG: hypothetical protein QF512_12165 [Alphaproteobacteria bacterium]|jgi:hypothetical protein|nr:hypothetical protein [Alphaproteobacteria bacterium]
MAIETFIFLQSSILGGGVGSGDCRRAMQFCAAGSRKKLGKQGAASS